MIKSNLWRKGFISSYSLYWEVWADTWRQELMRRGATYWLVQLSFCIFQDHQPRDGTTVSWALPHQSPIKKMFFVWSWQKLPTILVQNWANNHEDDKTPRKTNHRGCCINLMSHMWGIIIISIQAVVPGREYTQSHSSIPRKQHPRTEKMDGKQVFYSVLARYFPHGCQALNMVPKERSGL